MSGYLPYRPLRGAYFRGISAILVHNHVKDLNVGMAAKLTPEQREGVRRVLMDLEVAAADAWAMLEESKKSVEASLPGEAASPVNRIPAYEAAGLLGLSARRVTQMAKAGEIDGVKVRNRWMIAVSSVDDYRLIKASKSPG